MTRTQKREGLYFFEIAPRTEEQLNLDPAFKTVMAARMLCPVCCAIRPEWYPRVVDVRVDYSPKRTLYARLWWTGINVFRLDLMTALMPYLRDYRIGRCLTSSGKEVPRYRTCYTKSRIELVGERYSVYNLCPECHGRWLRPRGLYWILLRDAQGHHVLQDYSGALYLSPTAHEAVVAAGVKGVRSRRVPLIEAPPDPNPAVEIWRRPDALPADE
jgi:hypothetical protein